jgi:hypothetical protein
MPTLKLSQILQLSGIGIGVLGALRIIFAETDGLLAVLEVHWICLIVLGVGAATWFAGAWEAKHEAQIAGASAKTS